MPRKTTINQIVKTIADARDTLNRAANKCKSPSVRQHLTNKWAMLRQIGIILATRSQSELDTLLESAKGWEQDVG